MRLVAPALLLVSAVFAQDPHEGERKSYDDIYSQRRELFNAAPNAFLVRTMSGRKPGRALDVGMGQGRNALWLASQGWSVSGFDISPVAIAEARKEAEKRGLRLDAVVAPWQDFDWGREKWDLILFSYYFPKEVLPKVWESLKPGGLVLIEGFHIDTARVRPLGGGFRSNELAEVLKDYRLLIYEDVEDRQDWGLPFGATNRLVRVLAQIKGERAEERGGSTMEAEVSGVQLHERRHTKAADSAESGGPVQGADSGTDESDTRS